MSENSALVPIDVELAAGETVGEYVIERQLGQGAFGTVYRASHPLIGKVVAIKVLNRKCSVDPEIVGRFIAEAKAVNQIRNRHIIDIFAFGQLEDGRHYYVMEYLDGETLDAHLEREGPLSLADALPILRAVGRALDAAHAKNIAHRDLKPENIYLASDPDSADGTNMFVKLLDFGIAKLLADDEGLTVKTRTGISIGTPFYMSPEQCRGRDIDHRTDIYSFGVLAYQMLTGTYPIDGEDYMTILMGQVTRMPDPPSTRNPALPSAVDDVILQLMQKDPADRPTDLRSAVAALEAASGGVPAAPISQVHVAASPLARSNIAGVALPADRIEQRVRRSRAPLVVALGAVAAVAVVIVVMATGGRREAEPPALPPRESPRPAPVVEVVAPAAIIVAPPDAAIDAPLPDAPPPDAPEAATKRPKKKSPRPEGNTDGILDPF